MMRRDDDDDVLCVQPNNSATVLRCNMLQGGCIIP